MEQTPVQPAPKRTPLIPNLEFKVGLLLVLTLLLVVALGIYVLYARGLFEPTQKLVLISPQVEGIRVGDPMSFSGFPIGKVTQLDLTDDGKVRVEVAIPTKNAKWLRQTSVFTLIKGLIGGTKLKADTADMSDEPMLDGAVHELIYADASAQLDDAIRNVNHVLANVQDMTKDDSHINQALGHVETMTGRMAGEYGVLQGVVGSPEKAREIVQVIEKANTLMSNVNGISLKVDGMLAKADTQVFGSDGVMANTRQSVVTLNHALTDVRESLKKADAILASAQTATANVATITSDVKGATADMGQLRVEIDDSVRKVNHLINELNKKWPFAREVEIKTP
jgi:phospholipid/cholesterol/gamma-HCH transport system substrate-binding protein